MCKPQFAKLHRRFVDVIHASAFGSRQLFAVFQTCFVIRLGMVGPSCKWSSLWVWLTCFFRLRLYLFYAVFQVCITHCIWTMRMLQVYAAEQCRGLRNMVFQVTPGVPENVLKVDRNAFRLHETSILKQRNDDSSETTRPKSKNSSNRAGAILFKDRLQHFFR